MPPCLSYSMHACMRGCNRHGRPGCSGTGMWVRWKKGPVFGGWKNMVLERVVGPVQAANNHGMVF